MLDTTQNVGTPVSRPVPASASGRLPTCHGCRKNWYSAPGGQAWNRTPHSRCLALAADIPMIMGEHQKWLGSEVPAACPKIVTSPKARTPK